MIPEVLGNRMPKTQLAIEINTGAVRFVKLDGSFVVSINEFNFIDRQDYRYNQQLAEFLETLRFKEIDFDECSLSWSCMQSTLVPTNVYNESNANDIFKLCFGENFSSNEIEYNRIADPSIVNIHWLPFWLKSFFVVKFPRIVMQHEGTHLLRGIFKGTTFKSKAVIVLHQDFFTLILVKENNLHFYSHFEYSTVEDVVYYTNFTLQQKEWIQHSLEIVLNNGVGATVDLEVLLTTLTRTIGNHAKVTIEENLLAKYQELCV